ncbi:uncharacterized protein [Panulirus ornatus]|uniref:uncharacterized protein n=1 Tax=Panulirus ornatus TaxID=150431 RepID=UPI003A865AB0
MTHAASVMASHKYIAVHIMVLFQVVGWHTSSVTGSALKCRKEGRFQHPDDCGSYVDCLPTGSGGRLEAREGSCFGFPYSPSHRRCVSHHLMPGCVTKVSRSSIPLPSLQFLCEDDESQGAGCHHCKMSYKCIGGNVHAFVCSDLDTCLEDERFGGGDCLPYDFTAQEQKCKCEKIGLVSDSYNDTYYIFCDTSRTPPKLDMLQCPQDMIFSSDSKTCEYDSSAGSDAPETPACDGLTGTRVNPNECSWSYTCLPDGTVRSVPCKRSEYFDEITGSCVEKCRLLDSLPDSSGELCVTVGNNKDPIDCTKYHICTEIGGKPYQTKECPQGSHFDESENTCVSGQGDCSRFDYSQCPGHDDLNCSE